MLDNWQGEAIKQIYGNSIINKQGITIDEVERFYIQSEVYQNAIETPDMIVPYQNNHSIQKPTNEASDVNLNTSQVTYQLMNALNLNSYYKIIDSRDILWNNAYLRYAAKQSDCSNRIEYQRIDENTGRPFDNWFYESGYIYKDKIPSYINSSYNFLHTLDYIMNRCKMIDFMINVVKEQRNNINKYKTLHPQQ